MFVPCLGFEVGNLLLTMRVSGNNGGWVVAPWTMAWVEAADNAIGGCTTVTASLRLQSRDHSGNQRRRPLCCLCQLWWEIVRLPGSLWASGVGRLSLFPLIVASRKKQCFPLAQRAWWKYCDTIGHGAILPFSRFLNLCLKNLILSSKHTKRQCVVFQLCLHRRRSRQPMLSLSLSPPQQCCNISVTTYLRPQWGVGHGNIWLAAHKVVLTLKWFFATSLLVW